MKISFSVITVINIFFKQEWTYFDEKNGLYQGVVR